MDQLGIFRLKAILHSDILTFNRISFGSKEGCIRSEVSLLEKKIAMHAF